MPPQLSNGPAANPGPQISLPGIEASDLYQSIRVFHRQGIEYCRVNGTVNRYCCADAYCQREHRHGSEAGILQQLAARELQIIHISALPWDRLLPRDAPAASRRTARWPGGATTRQKT